MDVLSGTRASCISAALTVYVIEPQALLADALCGILRRDGSLSIVGEAQRVDPEALRQAAPQVILIDCDTELAALSKELAACRAAISQARICVLSAHLSAEVMMRSFSAGADGFIVKDVTPEGLVASLKAMEETGFYADPRLSSNLLKRRSRRDMMELSHRELDVVRLVAQGLSNKEISERLLLSDKTVKNHVANIFAKLNVTARTQVAVYAIRNGFV